MGPGGPAMAHAGLWPANPVLARLDRRASRLSGQPGRADFRALTEYFNRLLAGVKRAAACAFFRSTAADVRETETGSGENFGLQPKLLSGFPNWPGVLASPP